jgi:ubiquitin C-terminal hydrolase
MKPTKAEQLPLQQHASGASSVGVSRGAVRAWQRHLASNRSALVALFHGQLQSTITCGVPACRHQSTTYDPLMFLSLPVPTPTAAALASSQHATSSDTTFYKVKVWFVPQSRGLKRSREQGKLRSTAVKILTLARVEGNKPLGPAHDVCRFFMHFFDL